jgi:hypothetical protein
MKLSGNIQIPNILVYAILYAAIFAISIWLLIAHRDSPTNWLLYCWHGRIGPGGADKIRRAFAETPTFYITRTKSSNALQVGSSREALPAFFVCRVQPQLIHGLKDA